MKDNQEIRDELKEISPFLADMKKQQPFKVPANYFEQMQSDVFRQLKQEESVVAEPGPSWLDRWATALLSLLQPRYAVGFASIAVLIAAGIWILQIDSVPSTDLEMAFTDLDIEETQEYIASNIEDFETEWLFDLVSEDDIDFGDLETDEESDPYLDEIINELNDIELEELL